jgi:hypothetical protein
MIGRALPRPFARSAAASSLSPRCPIDQPRFETFGSSRRFASEQGKGPSPIRIWLRAYECALARAEIGHPDLGKQMRRSDDARWIRRQCVAKRGIGEGRPEMPDRFPDCIVEKRAGAADAAMQLRRDIAGLLFHPIGVMLPGGEQSIDVGGRDGEDVDQNRR